MFYKGIVESIDDPEQLGRVQVRLFSKQDDDKNKLPTEQLSWCKVAGAANVTSGSEGIGWSTTALKVGDFVVGFFLDDDHLKQEFLVCWTILGVPKKPENNSSFNHSVAEHNIDIPDLNRLARGYTDHTPIEERDKNTIEIEVQGLKWSEPKSGYFAKYPDNQVFQTKAGHLLEFDSTKDKERINIQHTKGTYLSWLSDGSFSHRVKGTSYCVIDNDFLLHVAESFAISTDTLQIGMKQFNIKGNNVSISAACYINGKLDINGVLQASSARFKSLMVENTAKLNCNHAKRASRLGFPTPNGSVSIRADDVLLSISTGKIDSNLATSPKTNVVSKIEPMDKNANWITPSGEVLRFDTKSNMWSESIKLEGNLSTLKNVSTSISESIPIQAKINDIWVDTKTNVVKQLSSAKEWVTTPDLSIKLPIDEKTINTASTAINTFAKGVQSASKYIDALSQIKKIKPVVRQFASMADIDINQMTMNELGNVYDVANTSYMISWNNNLPQFIELHKDVVDTYKQFKFGVSFFQNLPDAKSFKDRVSGLMDNDDITYYFSTGDEWIEI